MLNTDLHTQALKPERRMRCEDFIKNLRGVDDCTDIDRQMLIAIYDRIRANEFKPASDHVSQVMKVQATIIGKKPTLALPHRRLVCYCRLYEVPDINKKERAGVHQVSLPFPKYFEYIRCFHLNQGLFCLKRLIRNGQHYRRTAEHRIS